MHKPQVPLGSMLNIVLQRRHSGLDATETKTSSSLLAPMEVVLNLERLSQELAMGAFAAIFGPAPAATGPIVTNLTPDPICCSSAPLDEARKMPFTDKQVDEEEAHFANVIATFEQYGPYAVRTLVHAVPRVEFDSGAAAKREQPAQEGHPHPSPPR